MKNSAQDKGWIAGWLAFMGTAVIAIGAIATWAYAAEGRDVALKSLAVCQQDKKATCECRDGSDSAIHYSPIEGQVTLWPKHEEKGLMDMPEGATAYAVPWAMYATQDRRLWLYGDYPYTPERRGTSEMVVRKEHGKYLVDITNCDDHRWSLGSGRQPNETWIPLPVYGIRDEHGLTDVMTVEASKP